MAQERLHHIDSLIEFHEQRKRDALEVLVDANNRIEELKFQKAQIGGTAVRHLFIVPDIDPESDIIA